MLKCGWVVTGKRSEYAARPHAGVVGEGSASLLVDSYCCWR
jgi:hypothetical protein